MSELSEKTVGSAGAVCVFGLFIIWTMDFQLYQKLIATSAVALLVFVVLGLFLLKSWRLRKRRREQLRSHRIGDSTN